MKTPICDFVKEYCESNSLRLHMPGHKGKLLLGAEPFDITEISGADVLYNADGIINMSQQNAAVLFGTAKTVYSAEGSSLCIRAMLYMVSVSCGKGKERPLIVAARNAHKTFLTAAAFCDVDIHWLFPETDESHISCRITPERLDNELSVMDKRVSAVYITSPDYLGNIADVAALSRVCRRHGCLLIVDNAHGAYLNFLPENRHPIALGADMCCDSAHKTLPCLTGGAYLHISNSAPEFFSETASAAMSLFASTSPSYLILQSLDAVNRYLCNGYRQKLACFIKKVTELSEKLQKAGFTLIGDEALKITVSAKPYGYTGDELAEILSENGVVCEFCDPDYLVLMLTPEIGEEALCKIEKVFKTIEKREAVLQLPPRISRPLQKLSARNALFAPSEELCTEDCKGKILSSPAVSCPPAIPIVVCGEVIDETAIECFRYYGIKKCKVVKV